LKEREKKETETVGNEEREGARMYNGTTHVLNDHFIEEGTTENGYKLYTPVS